MSSPVIMVSRLRPLASFMRGCCSLLKSENLDTPAPRFAPDATSQVHPLVGGHRVYLR